MTTRFCKACFAPLKLDSLHALIHPDLCLCSRCLKALMPTFKEDKVNGIKGVYLFDYNNTVKEKIYTLKGCADIELAPIFLTYYQAYFKMKYRGYVIVPSPSSESDNRKRSFNHVEEIFKILKLPVLNIIHKKYEFKQSDLSKEERALIKDKLIITDLKKIYHRKVLFVDDISTTGSTLKTCLSLIKKGQPRKLHFLVVAKVKAKMN